MPDGQFRDLWRSEDFAQLKVCSFILTGYTLPDGSAHLM